MSIGNAVAVRIFAIWLRESYVRDTVMWSTVTFMYRLVIVNPSGVGMASRNSLTSDPTDLSASWHKAQGRNVKISDDAKHLKYVGSG